MLYHDFAYILTIILSFACIAQGFKAMMVGEFMGQSYFRKRRCLYTAVAGFTTTEMIFLVLIAMWLYNDRSDIFNERFNSAWWIYHTSVKVFIFAFHNSVLRGVKNWRVAIEKYGKDSRKN